MKEMKVVINEFVGFSIKDVYLYDAEGNIRESKEGLQLDKVRTYMNELQLSHDLNNNTPITNNCYDNDRLEDTFQTMLGAYCR